MTVVDLSDLFVWAEPWGVNDGHGRRLAFIHANAPRGAFAVRVIEPSWETGDPVPPDSERTGRDVCFPGPSRDAARKAVTKTLVGLGMTELPIRFALRSGERWTTVTETL